MLLILAIFAALVGIAASVYYLQKYSKKWYGYSIFSIGGMAVSFIGAVAFIFAFSYYNQQLFLYMSIALLVGIAPYIAMFIRDTKKTTITVAIAALTLRLVISLLLIAIIIWYFYMRRSSMDTLKDHLKKYGQVL
jgi:hypothetical protein